MATDYTRLDWQQTGTEITIKLQTVTGEINFLLDKSLLNHLVANSPKVVLFHIEITGQKEQTYIVDFENLISIPSTVSFLSVKIGEKKEVDTLEKTFTPLGKYCISRGESHYNKHISENGWQRQRKYFNVYNMQEVEFKTKLHVAEAEKIKAEQAKKKEIVKKEEKTKKKSKLVQCKSCGEIIPNLPACPYCGVNQ